MVGFIPQVAVVTFSLFDYFVAADMLMNIEYRLEKLVNFSRTAITYIHVNWGVPEPYNFALFGLISVILIIMSKKILGRVMGSRKSVKNFNFNVPDYSEIGILINSVKKLHIEVQDIKKALAV